MKKILFILFIQSVACTNPPDCDAPVFSPSATKSHLPPGVLAKRTAPKAVTPVENDSIRFFAPDSLMGYVEARNSKTDVALWKKQVYKVNYVADLEQDVQDVFIDSLVLKCDYLFIHNEKNEVYKLHLKTLQATKL